MEGDELLNKSIDDKANPIQVGAVYDEGHAKISIDELTKEVEKIYAQIEDYLSSMGYDKGRDKPLSEIGPEQSDSQVTSTEDIIEKICNRLSDAASKYALISRKYDELSQAASDPESRENMAKYGSLFSEQAKNAKLQGESIPDIKNMIGAIAEASRVISDYQGSLGSANTGMPGADAAEADKPGEQVSYRLDAIALPGKSAGELKPKVYESVRCSPSQDTGARDIPSCRT